MRIQEVVSKNFSVWTSYCELAVILKTSQRSLAKVLIISDFINIKHYLEQHLTMRLLSSRVLLLIGITLSAHVNCFVIQSPSGVASLHQRSFSSGQLHVSFMDFHIDPIDQIGDTSVNNRHSASDWLHNVLSLPKSSVLKDIQNPVITIAAWSTIVSIAQRCLASSSMRVCQQMATNMCIGSTPHNFLVSSLGLLLVFRTNSAYQRFYVSYSHRVGLESHPRFTKRESSSFLF